MPKNHAFTFRRPQMIRNLLQLAAAIFALTLFAVVSPAKAVTPDLELALDRVMVLRSADAKDRFLGSGFIWGDAGLVVTNAHVIGSAEAVRLIDAKGRVHMGEVIGRDTVRDVAVIAVAGLETSGFSAGSATALGADVWAIGAPLELDLTVTRGVVSAPARQVDAATPLLFLQHDAAVNPGSSGGPLLNDQGQLLGMNSRIADGSRHYIGISFAIPVADLERIVTGLNDETLPPFPRIGLQLRPVSREIAAALGIEPTGLLIDRVQPGALSETAGLMAGDIIMAAAGRDMQRPGDLAFAIEAALADGTMPMAILRGGQVIAVDLILSTQDSGVLGLRGIDGAAPLNRISTYRLEALGLLLDDEARVTTVSENSPALFAGMVRGDVILAVNGRRMVAADLRRLEITAPSLILLQRSGGATLHVVLDPWDTGEGIRPMGGANVLDPAVVVF